MSHGLGLDSSSDDLFPVHRACRDGDIGALFSLIQLNQTHLTAEDSSYGWTPLHWAAHYGQLDCVALLVQMGCEVNTGTSRFNQTPLHTSAFGGHPHCVVWLTEAGADVNSQDFVGEAPIHKAARSGSLECIQVLLLAAAKPHLRNASGQTAADLAHAQGFLDCFSLISKTKKHLLQLGGVHNWNSAPCGQSLHSRKRLQTAEDTGHMKKARAAENMLEQSRGGDELESMNIDPATTLGPCQSPPPGDLQEDPQLASSPTANQLDATAPAQRSSTDMCGSLHLTDSPSNCVFHLPAWAGARGADCKDFLHYGHYHGFGDTAEELSDYGLQEEHVDKQAM
ncbi:ankyrin repeat domain-containing protein 10a [Spinachia spinachia]